MASVINCNRNGVITEIFSKSPGRLFQIKLIYGIDLRGVELKGPHAFQI